MSVFERDSSDDVARGAPAIIVRADVPGFDRRDVDARLAEAQGLAVAIGIDVKASQAFRVRQVKPATLFGSGQVEQITDLVRQHGAELVVVDNALSPVQQSNLEKACEAKVIDRTGLILEIFGERAATNEGRLQVELAHLDYQAGRLVRSWTHLERQRGGFGFLGGPGETQIEADRRMIRDRMARIRRELDQVTRTRGLHRARRQRAPWPVIALVGYTNAGKSSLFNRMTGATVMAQDMLFATLDPTMRQIALPGLDKAILSDTVGFVSDLPTQLVAAFRATLEEVMFADLIVHVRDIAHPDTEAQRADVMDVLGELGVLGDEAGEGGPDYLEAWNKIDLLDAEIRTELEHAAQREGDAVLISAVSGEGIDRLQRVISDRMTAGNDVHQIDVAVNDGAAVAWLHEHGEVLSSHAGEQTMHLAVRLSEPAYARFLSRR
ncbi:GTPase HflX [Sphingobium subterraneum]|uniref:GTPase HflX n=1 Tax=Sphingobium subterraneum TaxID=627688 RepID=A0A841IWN6_9SPHN|nr:GTPase HflX [Sphingobium subterraneum]MBB6122562.1 GTP-binding protein HflX [Sphingobium subterraneum]